MAWIRASDGYEVSLVDGKIVARGPSGVVLKRVPAQLKTDEAVVGLRQAKEWLDRHDAACRSEVEGWIVRSRPVPTAVLAAVWPDRAWRDALVDLVVAPVGSGRQWDLERVGLLRSADRDAGVGVVNLDGDTTRYRVDEVALPHPVLLTELDELREFITDLGVTQGTQQLFREVWVRPDTEEERVAATHRYGGARFAQLRHLTGRAQSLGYVVRGGLAQCRIVEGGRSVTASVWVGSDDPSAEAETGGLTFDFDGSPLSLADVGPVAWSEGIRMAAALYAGRVIAEPSA